VTALNNHQLNVDSIADVLARDPGLTARIVSAANTAFFTGQREIRSIKEAVVRIGLSRVQVITTAILIGLRFRPENCPLFDIQKYWDSSIQLAMSASRLAGFARLDVPADTTYLCGLLHDIGSLIVADLFPKEMTQAYLLNQQEPEACFFGHQDQVLGFNAIHAGKEVATRWQLTSPVIEVINTIHTPEEGATHPALTRFMKWVKAWQESHFEETPDFTGEFGIPEKQVAFVARTCLKEQELIDSLVHDLLRHAA
jgi:HD-like signal output (HDOD) protein